MQYEFRGGVKENSTPFELSRVQMNGLESPFSTSTFQGQLGPYRNPGFLRIKVKAGIGSTQISQFRPPLSSTRAPPEPPILIPPLR
jgi:hypothetical protein